MMVSRTVAILLLCESRGLAWSVEQPISSILEAAWPAPWAAMLHMSVA